MGRYLNKNSAKFQDFSFSDTRTTETVCFKYTRKYRIVESENALGSETKLLKYLPSNFTNYTLFILKLKDFTRSLYTLYLAENRVFFIGSFLLACMNLPIA